MAVEESRSKDEPPTFRSAFTLIYLISFTRKIGVCLCFDDVSLFEFLREKGGDAYTHAVSLALEKALGQAFQK